MKKENINKLMSYFGIMENEMDKIAKSLGKPTMAERFASSRQSNNKINEAA